MISNFPLQRRLVLGTSYMHEHDPGNISVSVSCIRLFDQQSYRSAHIVCEQTGLWNFFGMCMVTLRGYICHAT